MRRFARLACVALALVAALPALAARCRAIDGDTLICGHERVRLHDIYAAEMNQAGGAAARRNLQRHVQGREVALHRYGQDRYGRTLADAYVDGRRIRQSDIGPRAGRGTTPRPAGRPGGRPAAKAR